MIWTLFALLLMVVLGGFISYYGDLQGRRWGKKRVSWFGMRPKHTAILITSLTGAFISLLSIVTLLIVSPVLREVILRGEQAIRDNKRVREDMADAMRKNKIQLSMLSEAKEKADQETTAAQKRSAQVGMLLTKLRQELKPMQEAVAQLEHQRTQLKLDLKRLQNQLANTEKQNYGLGKQNLALSRENGRLQQSNLGLAKSNAYLSTHNEVLLSQNRELTSTRTELTRQNEVLKGTNVLQANANLQELKDNAQKLSDLTAELNAKRQELALITGQLDKARQDLNYAVDELESSRRFFTLTYDQVRRGRVSVRAGGELARTVIDAHMSFSVVKQQLEKLLADADKTAQAVGAARGQNGRAVLIVPKRVATQAGEFYFDSEAESINAFAELLTGADKPNVVIISAFTNTIEGEQVPVNLQRSLVVPMFGRGAVLALARLNANLTDDQLKQAIAQFLQTNVRDALLKAGAISQVDPVSGINQLGQFDPIELGQLALKARQMRCDLILKAVAKSAISSADPLDRSHLILEVARASGNAKDS